MGKTGNFLKAAGLTVLVTGVLSASFIGINHLALAAATGRTEALPQNVATVNLPDALTAENAADAANGDMPFEANGQQADIGMAEEQDAVSGQPSESFVVPRLTVIESPFQRYHAIPPYALGMEEAALIGAYYIWEVFGESIDNMYVRMIFYAAPFMTRTEWAGVVSTNLDALVPPPGAVSMYIPGRVYQFQIDGITGERLGIWHFDEVRRPPSQEELEAHMNFRHSVVAFGWFDKSLDEQKAIIGLTPERLEGYTQTVKEFARRHFNTSAVVEIFLGAESPNPALNIDGGVNENGEEIFVLVYLRFTAIDSTGREAVITIPAETAGWRFGDVRIATYHNDIVPGFIFGGGDGVE